MYSLKNQRAGNCRIPKQISSVILSVKNYDHEPKENSFQQCAQKLKQIQALRRFEEIFQKDKHMKIKKKSELQSKEDTFYHYNHRLKGMFFLKKKVEFQEKDKHIQEQSELEHQNMLETKKITESVHQVLPKTANTLNFVSHPPMSSTLQKKTQSNKTIKTSVIFPKRPATRLHSTPQPIVKIFNSQSIVQLVLGANKIKVVSPYGGVFCYFNVYVEDGNNSEMIKGIIRKRMGWRVVESMNVAQMVWSQYFRLAVDTRQHRKYKEIQSIRDFGQSKMVSLEKKAQSSSQKKQNRFPNKNVTQKRAQQNALSPQLYQKQQKNICPHTEQINRKKIHQIRSQFVLFYNHFPNHECLSDKKHLFTNLSKYYDKIEEDAFEIIPYTIQINKISQIEQYTGQMENKLGGWIIKPGENSNRGKGITVCKNFVDAVKELKDRFTSEQNIEQDSKNRISEDSQFDPDKKNDKKTLGIASTSKTIRRFRKEKPPTYIIQKYIQPLLYNRRKFDIRMFLLITGVKGKIRGYLYNEGYIRTCSKVFTMDNFHKFIHLTNDAVQCHSSEYGKFEEGNKISWKKFQSWIQNETYQNYWEQFHKDIRKITHDVVASVHNKLLKKQVKLPVNTIKEQNEEKLWRQRIYYQVFGLDLIIDKQLKLWLIEVNTNPALNTDCSRTLNNLLPKMIENSLDIAVQPFIRVNKYQDASKYDNQFKCIFDDEWEIP